MPGNAPAPNFDPTKSNSVVISSAGQLGRGGNITIDGADNNDDVVGGPLQNVTQESVQEFQIATNRFSAESGRSASSVINVVTKSGSDQLRGSASLFARDSAWQGAAGHLRSHRRATTLPFDRQQIAGSAGGPLVPGRAFWFGAAEYRNQDGAVLVGARDVATRTIRRTFARGAARRPARHRARVDWRPGAADAVMVRYAGERATDTGASTLDRAIGSASQRQRSREPLPVGRRHLDARARRRRLLNAATVSFSTFDNAIAPVARGPQLTFPSIQDGSSFRVPQGTTQKRFQIADTRHAGARRAHASASAASGSASTRCFDLGVFRDGRIELVEDFATFDHNGDGRVDDDDLLFAVTLRSGKPDQALVLAGRRQQPRRAVRAGRLARPARPDAEPRPALRDRHRRQEHQPRRRDQPDRAAVPAGRRGSATRNNFGPRIGFNWAPGDGRTSVHGGYGIYYDRVTLQIQSLERGLDGRALPIEVRAGNVFFLDPDDRPVPAVRAVDRQPVHRLHPARRRRLGHQHHRQRACRTRGCSSGTSASSARCRTASCCASTASTTSARTSSSAGRSARSSIRSSADRIASSTSSRA